MDLIQSAQCSEQIEEPCSRCGGVSMHRVNESKLCCECYVKAGHTPASWHPGCRKWQIKLHPIKWKYTIGDKVTVNRNQYGLGNDAEAIIYERSSNGYESYGVIFIKNGAQAAWFDKDELTLIQDSNEEVKQNDLKT